MIHRSLIIDDEPDARDRLKRLLSHHADNVAIIGEAVDGPTGVQAILEHSPDLIFLDIQMPGLTGLDLLDSLPTNRWPLVVFTTAFDEFAIRAFELHALDYLLKPITAKRLQTCIERLANTDRTASRQQLERARSERRLERLMGRSGGRTVIINVDDVLVFESEDKLVFARTAGARSNLSITMKELEERLDPERFCRVHRQAIVQLSHARELHALAGGHYVLRLSDGSQVEIGRKYSSDFRGRFG